jgi:predicted nucleic acid-binding protein
MVKALFDTNILIDYLNGAAQAREEFSRYDDGAISIVTWMEVMVGASDAAAEVTRAFLERFDVIAIDSAVAEAAVRLRKAHRVKLPDAIVWASARTQGRLLVTRNTKDFPPDDPGVRVPYALP